MIGYERRVDGYWLLPQEHPRGLLGVPAPGPYPNARSAEAAARGWDQKVRTFLLCGISSRPDDFER